MKRITTLLLRIVLALVVLVIVVTAITLAPVDDTPFHQTDYYKTYRANLTKLSQVKAPAATSAIRAGWSKINLTPAYTTPTAGYGARKGHHWSVVMDSIFVRAIVLDNGATKAAMVSADLLIIPPAVSEQLKQRLPSIGFSWDHVYLGATHSHNSIGGWAEGYTGELFAGPYEVRIVEHITNKILEAIQVASKQMAPVQLGYGQMYQADMMRNRLVGDKGTLDPFIRLLKLQKDSGESALICTYAAHATTLDAHQEKILSRDYPGVLVDSLERKSASFAMFMAGAVGSMAPLEEEKNDTLQMRNEAIGLQIEIEHNLSRIKLAPDSSLNILTLPLPLREPHARISAGWRFRPWVFKKLFGDYSVDLKALRIGDVVFVGTPCDFSGELVNDFQADATKKGTNLLITSFNGGYVGYITPDKYYDMDAYETRTMNWYGPYNAAYFEEAIRALLTLI
ncbi:MAG: neutral/alkaline non-lysosomal ceramidase N-terminal domain-containing protein [Spirosomataceae bacterium]